MASPISLNPGGGTLAQQALATAPEGMLIAPVWRRAAAFMTDVIVLSLLLHFLSGQQLLLMLSANVFALETFDARVVAGYIVSWILTSNLPLGNKERSLGPVNVHIKRVRSPTA